MSGEFTATGGTSAFPYPWGVEVGARFEEGYQVKIRRLMNPDMFLRSDPDQSATVFCIDIGLGKSLQLFVNLRGTQYALIAAPSLEEDRTVESESRYKSALDVYTAEEDPRYPLLKEYFLCIYFYCSAPACSSLLPSDKDNLKLSKLYLLPGRSEPFGLAADRHMPLERLNCKSLKMDECVWSSAFSSSAKQVDMTHCYSQTRSTLSLLNATHLRLADSCFYGMIDAPKLESLDLSNASLLDGQDFSQVKSVTITGELTSMVILSKDAVLVCDSLLQNLKKIKCRNDAGDLEAHPFVRAAWLAHKSIYPDADDRFGPDYNCQAPGSYYSGGGLHLPSVSLKGIKRKNVHYNVLYSVDGEYVGDQALYDKNFVLMPSKLEAHLVGIDYQEYDLPSQLPNDTNYHFNDNLSDAKKVTLIEFLKGLLRLERRKRVIALLTVLGQADKERPSLPATPSMPKRFTGLALLPTDVGLPSGKSVYISTLMHFDFKDLDRPGNPEIIKVARELRELGYDVPVSDEAGAGSGSSFAFAGAGAPAADSTDRDLS